MNTRNALLVLLAAVCLLKVSLQPLTTADIAATAMDGVVLIECAVPEYTVTVLTGLPSTSTSTAKGLIIWKKTKRKIDAYTVSTAGFVVTDKGHILTVAHGLPMCRKRSEKNLTVTFLGSRKKYRATILRYNRYLDAALLQVPNMPSYVPTLSLANTDPAVGSRVATIGHPESTYWSVSEGIANFRRDWGMGWGAPPRIVLQITAPINHGNSGGPVFNDRGEVIGAVSFTDYDAFFLGFIVPYDVLKAMLTEI